MKDAVRALTSLPCVGPAAARDLARLGIRDVGELRDRDAGSLYRELRILQGGVPDRCVLHVVRRAVYWASAGEPDASLVRWWWFEDGREGAAALEALMEES